VLVLPVRWDAEAMALTFAGGAVGGFGLILFYRAMALELIGVVAPITAVIAAALPTAVGVIAGGERLHLGQAAGIVGGLVAIALITGGGRATRQRAGLAVGLAVVAGTTFGFFFIVYHAGSSAGVTAFISGRLGSLVVAVAYTLITRVRVVSPVSTWRLIGFAGVLDGLGVVLYLYATFHGLLSISAVLASFYPAFTILCARFVLLERLTLFQAAGAVLAIAAVAAIAAA
jgi:drug/metabolite transporter (DMT)-like permease